MKKLAIISGSDIRSFGGGEKWIIELYKRIQNFQTTIFSCREDNTKRIDDEKLVNLNIIYFKSIKLLAPLYRSPTFIGMVNLQKISTYNTIYLMDPSLPIIMFLIITLKLKRSKAKLVFGLHTPDFMGKPPLNINKFRWFVSNVYQKIYSLNFLFNLYLLIYKYFVFKIPNIHVLNTQDLKLLKNMDYKGKVYYIPNFLYYNINDIKIKQNKKEFIILFGGRLSVNQKGIDILIKVIQGVIKTNKNIKFHIFGSGEDGQKLVEELSNEYPSNVKYLGFTSNDQVENEYFNASLYIMTSRIEAFPAVILEAQAHGLPVIAFDIKGPHDIIKNDFQGKLIEPFKVEDFIEAILYYYKLWGAGKLSENYKRQIIDYIFSKYSDKKIIPKLEKMLMS